MFVKSTDSEQAFADTLEGQQCISYAQRDHQLRTRHMGTHAPVWTDAMSAEALRAGAAAHARSGVLKTMDAALAPAREAELVTLRAQADAARDERKQRLSNAWRG